MLSFACYALLCFLLLTLSKISAHCSLTVTPFERNSFSSSFSLQNENIDFFGINIWEINRLYNSLEAINPLKYN